MGRRGDRTGAPAVEPGLVLDDRYRLELLLDRRSLDGATATWWRALDPALGRPVRLLVVTGWPASRAGRLLDAASRAGRVVDARFVRVLDVGRLDRTAAGAAVWMATEWLDGPTAADAVRDEPLAAPVATETVRQCAEALERADRDGLAHGRLRPDRVFLPPGGVPRIAGLEVDRLLDDPDGPPGGDGAADVRGLGALLFTLLTGHRVGTEPATLPPVDPRTATQGRPRLVRAGIPRDVDEVTHRALSGGYADVAALRRALGMLPTRPLDAAADLDQPLVDARYRRWAWRLVPPVLVVLVGIVGWLVGSDLGRVPSTARQPVAAVPPARGTGAGGTHQSLVWHRPPLVQGFDPQGDGTENDDEAGLAVDRDATTSWFTDRYRGSSRFGGLKPGVGLLLDLRRPRDVSLLELVLTSPGSDLQVRAGDRRPARPGDLALVARRSDAGARLRLTVDPSVRARYWLLWFTNLPPDDGGFRIGVTEIALLG